MENMTSMQSHCQPDVSSFFFFLLHSRYQPEGAFLSLTNHPAWTENCKYVQTSQRWWQQTTVWYIIVNCDTTAVKKQDKRKIWKIVCTICHVWFLHIFRYSILQLCPSESCPTFVKWHSRTRTTSQLCPTLSIIRLAMSELDGDFPAADLKRTANEMKLLRKRTAQ